MPNLIDLTGHRFGRLVVTGRCGSRGREVAWGYMCDCGETGVARGADLRNGRTASCGCLKRDIVKICSRTHGRSRTPMYSAWVQMIGRCHNPNNESYERYGGRGIRVCERWRNSFEDFLADVGERPSPVMTIDRIDNNRGYEPGNVRWATPAEQNLNRQHRKRDARRRGIIDLLRSGFTQAAAAKALGLHESTIRSAVRVTGFVMPPEVRAQRSRAQAERMRLICRKKYGNPVT